MTRNDKATVSISTKQGVKDRLLVLKSEKNINMSKMLEDLVLKIEKGVIEVRDSEIIVREKVIEKVVEAPVETDDFKYERKFNRIIGMMEEKGYPDGVIERMIDGMMDNVREMGKYRKGRTEEWC